VRCLFIVYHGFACCTNPFKSYFKDNKHYLPTNAINSAGFLVENVKKEKLQQLQLMPMGHLTMRLYLRYLPLRACTNQASPAPHTSEGRQ
jgi:hypothetical protein